MFAKKERPAEVQEPVEALVGIVILENAPTKVELPDAEEEFIINSILAVEQELIGFRGNQQQQDQEEQNTLASIADIEHSCGLLPAGLAARKHLDAKLAELRLKLTGLNIKRQASEAAQAPLIANIKDLQQSLLYLEPSSEAAVLLQQQLDFVTTQLTQVQEATVDNTEAEFCDRLSILRKRLVKYRTEKYVQLLKKQFIQELDDMLAEFQSFIKDEAFVKDSRQYLKSFFSNPDEYLYVAMDKLVVKIAQAIDQTKIQANVDVLTLVERLLEKFDEDCDKSLIEFLAEVDLKRLFSRLNEHLDLQIEDIAANSSREINKTIAEITLQKKMQQFDYDYKDSLDRYKNLKPSVQKDLAYHASKYYELLFRLYRSILGEDLDKYSLIEGLIEDYEAKLLALYFLKDQQNSYAHLVILQNDLEQEKDEEVKEILELKSLICSLRITGQEFFLQSINIKILDILQGTDHIHVILPSFLRHQIFYAVYVAKLEKFLDLLKVADDLRSKLKLLEQSSVEEGQNTLLLKTVELSACSSQTLLAAMEIHYASCELSGNKCDKNFAFRMGQYKALIKGYAKHHAQTYADSKNPKTEFTIDEALIKKLYDLMQLLPESPLKSFNGIIKNYEFSKSPEVTEDAEWDQVSDEQQDEEEMVEAITDDVDEVQSHRSTSSLRL